MGGGILLSGVTSAVRGLFFPEGAGCPVCGRRGSPRHLCRVCVEMWAELAYGLTPCEKCGRFQSVKEEEKICPDCRNSEAPYCIARGVAPYEGAVREALHDFKFCGRRELAYPFGELMASMAVSIFPVRSIAAVIPVPLHENRLRERGFNQAAQLSEVVSRILKIPMAGEALVRLRETPSQTSLSREQRQANLKGAFEVGKQPPMIKGKTVLLVDDVYTTGATVQECSRVLVDFGVKEIYVVTLASGILTSSHKG
jgi:ComF family protein